MTSPRHYQTEGVVIRKTKLGEADSILTLYTPHLGKIQGFAKSLRKTRSKMAGHLELMTHSMVVLARGRNVDTITGAQTIDSFLPLKIDLDLTSYGLYVVELVNQFMPDHQENYPVFQLLLDTLERLSRPGDKELVLRHFELHLLESVGYRPQLQQCPACRTVLQPEVNYFSPTLGGAICPDCSRTQIQISSLSVNALKVLRLLQGDDYATVSRLKLPDDLILELEGVLRHYLRYLLERDVKSAAWLDMLKRKV